MDASTWVRIVFTVLVLLGVTFGYGWIRGSQSSYRHHSDRRMAAGWDTAGGNRAPQLPAAHIPAPASPTTVHVHLHQDPPSPQIDNTWRTPWRDLPVIDGEVVRALPMGPTR